MLIKQQVDRLYFCTFVIFCVCQKCKCMIKNWLDLTYKQYIMRIEKLFPVFWLQKKINKNLLQFLSPYFVHIIGPHKTSFLFYSSGTGFILFERYRFYSIRTVLRVRCRVLQSHLGTNCRKKYVGNCFDFVILYCWPCVD